VLAIHWQDATHLLLADSGDVSGYPYIYRLSLEDLDWGTPDWHMADEIEP
jgi:hypothetical protein